MAGQEKNIYFYTFESVIRDISININNIQLLSVNGRSDSKYKLKDGILNVTREYFQPIVVKLKFSTTKIVVGKVYEMIENIK